MFRSVQAHPYHLVEPSPWPLLVSLALLTTTLSAVMTFHGVSNGPLLLSLGLLSTILTMALWFISVTREATAQGNHTFAVQKGLTLGFLLFIISEVFFFLSFFWAFFHSALAPTVELGSVWPPAGIEALNTFEVPLLNTVLLLSSGATLTYSHHCLIAGNRKGSIFGLYLTIILAVIFTLLQAFEYYNSSFTISDGVYGSTFYMTTGLHGLHVLVGTIFLVVGLVRLISYHFTDTHHLGFESAIIYWHFVDVVWLFLFISIYWWGSPASPLLFDFYSNTLDFFNFNLVESLFNITMCECEIPPDPFANPTVFSDVLENRSAIMKEIRDQAGIYAFTNLENLHQYIGSSVNLGSRFTRHLNGSSSNIILQHAFLKYGISAFTFSILCFCPRDQLLSLEQLALDTFQPYYNICKTAGSNLGYRHTPESKSKFTGANHYASKTVYVFNSNNQFLQEFSSYRAAANYCNVVVSTVHGLIDTGRVCKRQWIFKSSLM
jgi:cytochrome c oxidase subunit 3